MRHGSDRLGAFETDKLFGAAPARLLNCFQDETIFSGLTEFLACPNANVVYMASKILLLLSETDELCAGLIKIPELLTRLSEVSDRLFPPKVLRNLLLVRSRISNHQKSIAKNVSNEYNSLAKNRFLPTRESRNVVFKIDALDASSKRSIESVLLRKNGIVSLYFDTPNRRVVIRAMKSLGVQELAAVVMKCSGCDYITHVTKNEMGVVEDHNYYLENFESGEVMENPQYPDFDVFDSKNCIATKEQVASAVAGQSWFTSIRSLFW
ncbi:hypothetical protein L596_007214 [Steinernema carpocapsae]|uniref:Armadillo repeat-containing protein 1 n=1 Tax=Steinernema carpocapsae TaxID=34508 RepID=A0A4U5P8M1_STECR|nr:hypothetical protein L596_007214 [Steinernema carpocapsae]